LAIAIESVVGGAVDMFFNNFLSYSPPAFGGMHPGDELDAVRP
jgi:hypothetical protein